MKLDNTTGDASRTKKLTSADVRRIRELSRAGATVQEIRRNYPHVSRTCIGQVCRRITWGSVE